LELTLPSLPYFWVRIALGCITACVAVLGWRSACRSARSGHPWVLPAIGGVLLFAAAALSAYDAVDNAIIWPEERVTLASWLWFLLFDLVMPIWAVLAIRAREERDRAIAELAKLSVTDQLTGVLNRRGFTDRCATAIAQSRRLGRSTALVILDIDRFKAINDNHGHAAGDHVLRSFAIILSAALRAGDLLGRMGGEEFAVLLYDSAEGAALTIAERIRGQVRNAPLHPAGSEARVTVSGGIALVSNQFEPETALLLAMTAADEALYTAKREGRDRIAVAVAEMKPQAVTQQGTTN
jgi:diguanylate cyclase (GGDEF)-like protein